MWPWTRRARPPGPTRRSTRPEAAARGRWSRPAGSASSPRWTCAPGRYQFRVAARAVNSGAVGLRVLRPGGAASSRKQDLVALRPRPHLGHARVTCRRRARSRCSRTCCRGRPRPRAVLSVRPAGPVARDLRRRDDGRTRSTSSPPSPPPTAAWPSASAEERATRRAAAGTAAPPVVHTDADPPEGRGARASTRCAWPSPRAWAGSRRPRSVRSSCGCSRRPRLPRPLHRPGYDPPMPIGTCFHSRTAALCESMSWRDWAGYFAVSSYEVHHEREYSAIRNAAALIDISPLFKYRVSGKDATRLVDRVVTRDVPKMKVGQVAYTNWCDGRGQGHRRRHGVAPGGERLPLDGRRAQPALDPHERARPGRRCGGHLRPAGRARPAGADQPRASSSPASRAPTWRASSTSGSRPAASRGIPVEISRTGYTGDLGYEIWVAWDQGGGALGRAHGRGPALRHHAHRDAGPGRGAHRGRPHPPRRGLHELAQGAHPVAAVLALRDRAGAARAPRQGAFIGQQALRAEAKRRARPAARGPRGRLGRHRPAATTRSGLPPQIPATASRVSVPVYRDGGQVGQGHQHHLVAHIKEDDRPGHASPPTRPRRARAWRWSSRWTTSARTWASPCRPLPFFDPPRKRA